MDTYFSDILNLDWNENDKIIIERVLSSFKTWKKFLPNQLKDDILHIIQLAINEKKKIK